MCQGDADITHLELVARQMVASLCQLGVGRRPTLVEHEEWMLQSCLHRHLYSLLANAEAEKHTSRGRDGLQLDHSAVIDPHVGTKLGRVDKILRD